MDHKICPANLCGLLIETQIYFKPRSSIPLQVLRTLNPLVFWDVGIKTGSGVQIPSLNPCPSYLSTSDTSRRVAFTFYLVDSDQQTKNFRHCLPALPRILKQLHFYQKLLSLPGYLYLIQNLEENIPLSEKARILIGKSTIGKPAFLCLK